MILTTSIVIGFLFTFLLYTNGNVWRHMFTHTFTLANQADAVIDLDPSTTYQTISGWEATAQAGQLVCGGFSNYQQNLLDQAVNDLGINRLRVEIRSGTENPIDYYDQFVKGLITRDEYRAHWYESINDNADPGAIDSNGFKFTEFDTTFDKVVLPMKQLLEARGESLHINVNYIDFAGSTGLHRNQENEYAEFVLATYQHLQTKYGLTPDSWEVILEPDNTPWTGTHIGKAIAAAGSRLQANGFTPRFVAPSTTNMATAIPFFDAIVQVPNAAQYLDELSYHRYAGVSDTNLATIASRANQYGIQTAMLEHIGSGYPALHSDLAIGENSAWQQFALGFCVDDNGSQYYTIDNANPAQPVVSLSNRAKFLRQYMKFIRRGAIRITATSSNSNFEPLAFINSNGAYVVVVRAKGGGSFSVQDLPDGIYGVKYTTDQGCDGVTPLEYDKDLPDVALAAGQILTTSIPACGVITIYEKSSPGPAQVPPASVTISGPTAGDNNTPYNFTAQVQPISTTLPVTYTWAVDGEVTAVRTAGVSDTLAIAWDVTGSHTVIVTATNAVGSASDQHPFIVAPEAGLMQFSSSAYNVAENSSSVVITVERIGGLERVLQVSYVSSDGTATAGADYQPVSGTLTFTQGMLNKSISMPLIDDFLEEEDETIHLALSNPTNEAILGVFDHAVVTVSDNNSPLAPERVTISGPTSQENVSVTDTFTATVTPVSVTLPLTYLWQINDRLVATHTGGSSDTLSIQRGDVGSYQFVVTATNAAGAVSGVHTLNVVPVAAGKFTFGTRTSTVGEDATAATVVVLRTQGTDGEAGVSYTATDGTAVVALDYSPASGNLTFAESAQSQSFQIPIVDDDLVEGNETFTLTLSNPTGGAALGAFDTAVVTILDDDDEHTPGGLLPFIVK
jgi:hypothetical protein